MSTLEQYSRVCVVKLRHPPEKYDGWRLIKRSPQVGDIGTIVDILHALDRPDDYIVESSGPDGITTWLGDFEADELEPL